MIAICWKFKEEEKMNDETEINFKEIKELWLKIIKEIKPEDNFIIFITKINDDNTLDTNLFSNIDDGRVGEILGIIASRNPEILKGIMRVNPNNFNLIFKIEKRGFCRGD